MFYMWFNEKRNYNFVNGIYGTNTRHFTQVIWKNTTEIGCSVKCNGNRCYGCCNYKTPGNVEGRFSENVQPF